MFKLYLPACQQLGFQHREPPELRGSFYQLRAGNFGAVTSALDPRILEFALRVSF
jgi:hypothetical protein